MRNKLFSSLHGAVLYSCETSFEFSKHKNTNNENLKLFQKLIFYITLARFLIMFCRVY